MDFLVIFLFSMWRRIMVVLMFLNLVLEFWSIFVNVFFIKVFVILGVIWLIDLNKFIIFFWYLVICFFFFNLDLLGLFIEFLYDGLYCMWVKMIVRIWFRWVVCFLLIGLEFFIWVIYEFKNWNVVVDIFLFLFCIK